MLSNLIIELTPGLLRFDTRLEDLWSDGSAWLLPLLVRKWTARQVYCDQNCWLGGTRIAWENCVKKKNAIEESLQVVAKIAFKMSTESETSKTSRGLAGEDAKASLNYSSSKCIFQLLVLIYVYVTYMNKTLQSHKIFIQLLPFLFSTINGSVFDGLITTHNSESTH